MNFIEREASSYAQPRACMCNTDARFLTSRSNTDTCANYGCLCSIILSSGNFTTASATNRKS